jgi:hypothetical protein
MRNKVPQQILMLHAGYRKVVVLVMVLFTLQACVTSEVDPNDLKFAIDKLYPHQSEEIRLFFAQEAARAGVIKIRALKVGEKRKKIDSVKTAVSVQTACGGAHYDKKLLINPRKQHCLRLAHLAHEISHIGVLGINCYGHGEPFYQYNLGIAKRFEQQFPELTDRGGWNSPLQNVETRSRNYRSGAEQCL